MLDTSSKKHIWGVGDGVGAGYKQASARIRSARKEFYRVLIETASGIWFALHLRMANSGHDEEKHHCMVVFTMVCCACALCLLVNIVNSCTLHKKAKHRSPDMEM